MTATKHSWTTQWWLAMLVKIRLIDPCLLLLCQLWGKSYFSPFQTIHTLHSDSIKSYYPNLFFFQIHTEALRCSWPKYMESPSSDSLMHGCNWLLSLSEAVHGKIHTTGKIQYHDFIKFVSNTIYLNKVEHKKKVKKNFVTEQAAEIMYFTIIFCPISLVSILN